MTGCDGAGKAERSHPESEARGGSREEPPTPEARASSQEGLEELSHVEGQELRW